MAKISIQESLARLEAQLSTYKLQNNTRAIKSIEKIIKCLKDRLKSNK